MSKAYHNTKWEELVEKWAISFYEANVAFNVVRHLAFIAAMQATLLACFHYEPPSYHAMRMSIIEPTKKRFETKYRSKQRNLLIPIVQPFSQMDGTMSHIGH
jgi:hypothetical protein